MNHLVKPPANSTDTSRLGRSGLQEKATQSNQSNSRLKGAQIKQAVTPGCTGQCCHQLPHEQISTHTLCYTISQVHLHPTFGFISSHVRSNMTEVNAVTVSSIHVSDIRVWLWPSWLRWNWLQRIQEFCSEMPQGPVVLSEMHQQHVFPLQIKTF